MSCKQKACGEFYQVNSYLAPKYGLTLTTPPPTVSTVQSPTRYTWRTIGGISSQTGLPENKVAQIIAKYNLNLTRLSEVPSISGSALVGLIENVGA